VDVGCKSLISICFSKIAGTPIGSLKFLGSKEESMACVLRRDGITDSGLDKQPFQCEKTTSSKSWEKLELQCFSGSMANLA
jgi:hypothetical protein